MPPLPTFGAKKLHSCYVVTFWASTNHYVKYYLWQSDIQRYPFFGRIITLPVGGSISLFVHRGAVLHLPGEKEQLAPSDMNVKLTLIEKRDLTNFRTLPTSTLTQQICSSLVFQSLGDDFFYNRNFHQAFDTYEDALRLITLQEHENKKRQHGQRDHRDIFSGSDTSFRVSLYIAITLSAATSALMTRSFDVAILYCDQILARSPAHVVAITRKVQALRMLKQYDMAMSLAAKAVSIVPSDPNVIREWRHVRMALMFGCPESPSADLAFGGPLFIGSPKTLG
ncbi:hypothetical protein J8273_6392 [Carpediemonas membranifera]|uniref:Tetratricopeptide repeat protein n=1 Tax=Carpediemonas membranifera TaxID=201153 RepID=A0A8J6E291_9EUKA|nr:hypothetical protein J8273_6392 [Carpediemonas membranifera]|eukprot:KAG9391627.1 hypothetical protein J8273_6392 [Carpediemonas membranifera]